VAASVFFIIATAVATSSAVATIDGNVERWLHVRATPLLAEVMAAVSFLGAPSTLTVVVVAGGLVLLWWRRYVDAAMLLTVVLGGNLVNFCLKHLFERGRPVFEDPLFSLPTYSFPSGHAMASTVFYGLLAMYASVHARQPYAAVAAISMVAVVCFSRVYLGLHYTSDVMGGIAEGLAWLALSATALRYIRRRSAGIGGDS
jgi:membrane-associated phospholipid phosphatase